MFPRRLEADGIIGDSGVQNFSQGFYVEGRIMGAVTSGREFHHGYADLVLQSRLDNGSSAEYEIVHIIQRVKVSYGRNPVFLKSLA
jgi:hypothetical protein